MGLLKSSLAVPHSSSPLTRTTNRDGDTGKISPLGSDLPEWTLKTRLALTLTHTGPS